MSILIDDLRKLPLSERLELVETLWDSIAADADQLALNEKQAEALDVRLAGHEDRPGEGVSWQELRDRLHSNR